MADRTVDEDDGPLPTEFVVLGGCARVFAFLIASLLLALFWLVATGVSFYFAFTLPINTYFQSVAASTAATLILFVAAPVLFGIWKIGSVGALLLSLLAAAVLVLGAAIASGATQTILVNLGCGLALLLVLNFWVQGAVSRAIKAAEAQASEEASRSSGPLL